MNMTEEALKLLIDTAQEADAPDELYRDDTAITFYGKDGKPLVVPKMPKPRQHTAGCLDEIIALANRFAAIGTVPVPVVWYDLSRVVLVIDDDGHRLDMATFNLELSDTFERCIDLRKKREWHTDKDFIKLLRLDLARTLKSEYLLEHIRNLRWSTTTDVASVNTRAKESIDRTVKHEIHGGERIPEEVMLSLPVFKSPGEDEIFNLACIVETDLQDKRICLQPYPDEIERVQNLALAGIGARLREGLKGVPAYHGQP